MDQEQFQQAQMLERKHQELQQNLELVESQIKELEEFKEEIKALAESKESSSLSSLGKGVYVKSSLENKEKLFVEVGSNVIVRKTAEDTGKTIESQIKRLMEARIQITAQLEIYQQHLQDIIGKIET